MSRRSRHVDQPAGSPARTSGDRGDTLLEVLIALVIIGLTAAALLTAFATAITSSRVHRDIATNDQVLRSVTETAFSQIQQDASPKYISCGSAADYQLYFNPSAALPNGSPLSALYAKYQIAVTSVEYWDSSNNSFGTSCAPGSTTPQLITMTMTPPYGSSSQFQLTVASQGSVSSVTVTSANPTSASAGSTTPVTVNGSGFDAGAVATFNCQGGTYPATTSTVNSSGTAVNTTLTLPSGVTPGGCTVSVVNSNGTTGTSGTIFAIVGPVAKFRVNVPSVAYVGMPFTVTLTAEDSAGNVVTSYSGSKTIGWSCTISSGSCAGAEFSPASSVDFSGGMSGAIQATLNDSGSNVITATESSPTSGITGSNSVMVIPLYLNWSNATTGPSCVTGSTSSPTALNYTGCGSSVTFSAGVTLVNASGSAVSNTGNEIALTVTGPTNATLDIPNGSSTTTTPLSTTLTLKKGKTLTITVSSPLTTAITATFQK